jgi:hypothetical protein
MLPWKSWIVLSMIMNMAWLSIPMLNKTHYYIDKNNMLNKILSTDNSKKNWINLSKNVEIIRTSKLEVLSTSVNKYSTIYIKCTEIFVVLGIRQVSPEALFNGISRWQLYCQFFWKIKKGTRWKM